MPIILLLLTLFTITPAFAANLAGCGPYLDLRAFGEAMEEGVLTPQRLETAQEHMLDGLAKLSLWKGKDWIATLGNSGQYVSNLLTLSLSFYVRGADTNGDSLLKKVMPALKALEGISPNYTKLRTEMRALAARPEIERPFGTAENVAANRPPAEYALIKLLGAFPKVGLVMAAQQIEMVKLIHQFALTQSQDKIFYAGEGATAVLYGVSLYARARNYLGLDPRVLPAEVTSELKPLNIEIAPGWLDDQILPDLTKRGPYNVVAALDSVANDPQLQQRLLMNPVEVARELRRMVAPGGVLILLNDYKSRPYFTRQQVERAGFTVVRWDLDRAMSPALRDLMPYDRDLIDAGELRAFVLRNGPERDLSNATVRTRNVGTAP